MGYTHLKEIQHSPEFGKVLPIDFENNQVKLEFYPTEEIFSEIKDFCTKNANPDYIWLKGIDDISLFLGFHRLLNMIKITFPNQKIGVYIKVSLFSYEIVLRTLLLCDLVTINLNSIVPSNFYIRIKGEDLEKILNNILSFKNEYKGYFSIYTMLFKGINDNLENIVKLKNYLSEVKPNHFSISIFTGNNFEAISDEFKLQVKKMLQDLPFKVSFKF